MSGLDWYKVEQLPWPVDWAEYFGRPGPLVVEIGFGSGQFLADLAGERPEVNFIGLEISVPSLRNAARKVRHAELAHVCLLQASAQSALQALCTPGSVDHVIINFPDPWPKKDQLGRRLIDDKFLCLLAGRMRTGALLDIATDHADYAGQIEAVLLRSEHFTSRIDSSYSDTDERRRPTKYESVALAEGRQPRYFKWRRNETAVANHFPIPEELAMPHVVMRLPADLSEIGRRFRPSAIEVESTHIRFVEAYQSLRDDKLLIETYINEDPILQRLALQLRPRPTGELVISLAEVGFPRPTHGVHRAIDALVEWLRGEFPSLVVVQTNLRERHADTPR